MTSQPSEEYVLFNVSSVPGFRQNGNTLSWSADGRIPPAQVTAIYHQPQIGEFLNFLAESAVKSMQRYVNSVIVFFGGPCVGKTSLSTGYNGLLHKILESAFADGPGDGESLPINSNSRTVLGGTQEQHLPDSEESSAALRKQTDADVEYYLSVFEIYEDCVVDHFGPEQNFESSVSSPRITDAKCQSLDQALQLLEHARAQSSNYSDTDGLTRAEPIPSSSILLGEVKLRCRTKSGSTFISSALVVDLVSDESQKEFLDVLRALSVPNPSPTRPAAHFIPYLISRLRYARIALVLLLGASEESLRFSQFALPVLDQCNRGLTSMDLPGGTLATDTDGKRTQTVSLGAIKEGAEVLLATHVEQENEEGDGGDGVGRGRAGVGDVGSAGVSVEDDSLLAGSLPGQPEEVPPHVELSREPSPIEREAKFLPAQRGFGANDESSYLQADQGAFQPAGPRKAVTFTSSVVQRDEAASERPVAALPSGQGILPAEGRLYAGESGDPGHLPADPLRPGLEDAPEPPRAKSASAVLSPSEAAIFRRYAAEDVPSSQVQNLTLREARIRFQEAERSLRLSEQRRESLATKIAGITAEIAELSLASELKLRAAQKRLDDVRSVVSRGLDSRGASAASARNPLNKQGIVDLQNILTACEGDLRELETQLYSAATQSSEDTIQTAYELCPRGSSAAHLQHLVSELRNLTERHIALEKTLHKLQRRNRGTHAKILLFRDLESKHRVVSEECSRRTAERKELEGEVEQLRELSQRTQIQLRAARQEASRIESEARDLEVELSTLKLARRNLEGLSEEAPQPARSLSSQQALPVFQSEERAILRECRRLVSNAMDVLSPDGSSTDTLSLGEMALLDALRGRLQQIDGILG